MSREPRSWAVATRRARRAWNLPPWAWSRALAWIENVAWIEQGGPRTLRCRPTAVAELAALLVRHDRGRATPAQRRCARRLGAAPARYPRA